VSRVNAHAPVPLSDDNWRWVLRFLADYESMTKTPSREAKVRELIAEIRGWLPDRITEGES
jgi:hypothetical protein